MTRDTRARYPKARCPDCGRDTRLYYEKRCPRCWRERLEREGPPSDGDQDGQYGDLR